MTGPAAPSAASTLSALTQPRILDLGWVFGVRIRSTSAAKKQRASTLGTQLEGRLPLILRELGREELQAVCRAHDLAHTSSSRRELIETLLVAARFDPSASIPPPIEHHRDGLPRPGQIVRARHRQWLVEHVDADETAESARLSLRLHAPVLTPRAVPGDATLDLAKVESSFHAARGSCAPLARRLV